MMPGRPRQHVLEDKSEARFRELILPWIFRRLDKDYGVDGQVEIVAGDQVTGRTFSVQLKATAKPIPDALRVRLRRSNWDYLRNRPELVLLALYVEGEDTFYTQWIQSVDPFYATVSESGTSFDIPIDRAWPGIGHTDLLRDVESWHAIQRGISGGISLLTVSVSQLFVVKTRF